MADKARKKRKKITPEIYNNVKDVYKALKDSGSPKATASYVAEIMGISNTTSARIIRSRTHDEYLEYQRAFFYALKERKAQETQEAQEEVQDVRDTQELQDVYEEGSFTPSNLPETRTPVPLQPQTNRDLLDRLDRIALALEDLVEAWNKGSEKKKGIFG